MSADAVENGVGDGDFSHELLIRRDNGPESSTQQSSIPGGTSLSLAQGENWLRLVVFLDRNIVLQDTQETSMGAKPFPSITSLADVGTIDAPTKDCYICIDVDGPYAAIKDMRDPVSSQVMEEESEFDVFLARKKQQHERLASLADSQASEDGDGMYYDLDPLEPRQLRFLRQGDRILVRCSSSVGGEPGELILEYHQYSGERPRSRGEDEFTQSNTIVGFGASGGSDGPQTQAEGSTPRSPGEEDYKTAVEPTTQDSDEETSSLEGEATQAYPRPTMLFQTQSPERERDSDDETSVDVNPPESEKYQDFLTPANEDVQDKGDGASQPKNEGGNGTTGTQQQGNGDPTESTTDSVGSMNQSTQPIPTMPDSVRKAKQGENSQEQLHKDGNEMSPVPEEPATQSSSKDVDVSQEPAGEQPVRASNDSTVEKKAADAEDSESDTDDEENPTGEDEIESDSDALLDEEDIKDASADVEDTPKKVGGTKADGEGSPIEATKAQSSNENDEEQKPSDLAPIDDQMSDSSSITEVEEEAASKRVESATATMEGTKEPTTATTNETALRPEDDASHASSLTEAGDMVTPRKGLETAPRDEQNMEAATDKPSFQKDRAEDIAPGANTVADDAAPPKGKDDTVKASSEIDEIEETPVEETEEPVTAVASQDDVEEQGMKGPTDRDESSSKSSTQEKGSEEAMHAENAVPVDVGEPDESTEKESNQNERLVNTSSQVAAPENTPKDSEVQSEELRQEQTATESTRQQEEDEDSDVTEVEGTNNDETRNESKIDEPMAKTSSQKDGTAEAVTEKANDEGTVVDASETSASPEVSGDQLSHSAETAVTNNRSPTVDRHEMSNGKDMETPTAADGGIEEAKGVEESDSTAVDIEEKVEAKETTASAENNEVEAKSVEEDVSLEADSLDTAIPQGDKASDVSETPKAKTPGRTRTARKKAGLAKKNSEGEEEQETEGSQETPPKEREASSSDVAKSQADKATGDSETSKAKTPGRTRTARKKAALAEKSEEEEQEAEKPQETPVKKRARSTRKKATPAPEPEPENEAPLKTPAKKRTRTGYGLRGSARKQTTGTPSSPGEEPIRVLMTGVGETDKHKKMIGSIGAELIEKIENAHKATHVIAGDDKTPFKRTPKLMIGICRTSNILSLEWLIKSAKVREALACNDFLLLKDKKAERMYDFKMREALQRGDALRRNDEFLLSGYFVYVCNGVAGNKAPPEKELELIVDAAGGKWLSSIAPRVMKGLDASKLLIISPETPTKKKAKLSETKDVDKAIKLGAQDHPPSWLFQCIIRQSLED